MKANKTILIFSLIIFVQFCVILLPDARQAFWLLNIMPLILIPYQKLFAPSEYYPKEFGFILIVLIAFNLFTIFRGLINPWYQSLFSIVGNPAFSMYHLLPVFVLVADYDKSISISYKSLIITALVSLIFALVYESPGLMHASIYFSIAFFPYLLSKRSLIGYFGLIVSLGLMSSLYLGNRMIFLVTLIFVGILLLIRLSTNFQSFKNKARLFIFTCIAIPYFFFAIAVTTGFSIFDIADEFQFLQDSDRGSEDTRTFVWQETLEDLVRNNSIIFGKGMAGTIKTVLPSFVDATIVDGRRLFVEAGYLENIRRGGIFFALLNTLALIFAVIHALRYSQNKMLILASMALSVHFLLSFIGHNPVYSYEYLIYWIYIGFCASKKINALTDDDIAHMIHGDKIKKHKSLANQNSSIEN